MKTYEITYALKDRSIGHSHCSEGVKAEMKVDYDWNVLC